MESVQDHVRAHPAVPSLLDRLQRIQALWEIRAMGACDTNETDTVRQGGTA